MTQDRFTPWTWIRAGWLPTVVLLIATAVIGPELGGVARPAFILGCLVVGWYAWRQSAEAHIQAVIVLFVFAPFVRRLVDQSAGFDPSGLMLIGPLLTILAPVASLWTLLLPGQPRNPWLVPPAIVLGCIAYGAALSMFQDDWFNAASGVLKWAAPILYGIALQQRARPDSGLVDAATGAFVVVLPIAGIYGIMQYVDPQVWDRYWMLNASITSAGYPEPYAVRVFSTMNGPASYATFTAAGLLLVGFLRSDWKSLVAMAPAALGLLLSLYRTAWLMLALGVLFCMLFQSTRKRAVGTGIGIAGAILAAATLTPFSETITDRLETLASGTDDGSGGERLGEFITLWNLPDSMVVGTGFTVTDAGSAGAMPIDGQIVANWITMGIPVGLLCLAALVWVGMWATTAAWRIPTKEGVVLGALGLGAILIQMPLASIASGELGVLFWMLSAMACPQQQTQTDVAAPQLPLRRVPEVS